MSAPIPVLFLLLPGSLLLDWAGPAEALRIADQARAAQGLPPRFALRFIGPQRSPRTSLGVAVANGWMTVTGDRATPTELGRRFTNDVVELFLP